MKRLCTYKPFQVAHVLAIFAQFEKYQPDATKDVDIENLTRAYWAAYERSTWGRGA